MKESEKRLEPKFAKHVKEKLGGWALKIPGTVYTGFPDRLCLLPGGKVVFAELKSTGDKPRKIQLVCHAKLCKLGFEVWIIDSTELINKFIEKYAE